MKQTQRIGIIVALAAVLLVGSAFAVITDLKYRGLFSAVKTEMSGVQAQATDKGAVQMSAGDPAVDRGDGLISYLGCRPDVMCPTTTRSWFVPVDPGMEQQYAESVLQQAGFTNDHPNGTCKLESNTCGASGRKGDMSLSISFIARPGAPLPAQNVAPKAWRYVTASVVYSPAQ